jgi:hypothetical protein
MTIEDVKSDLRDIQYYYAHEKEFVSASRIIGDNSIRQKVMKYNDAACKAPLRLYYVYVSLYVHFNTQLEAAYDMDCSLGFMKKLNRDLCDFLLKELRPKDEKEQKT